MNGQESKPLNIDYGVANESLLGPLLLLVYTQSLEYGMNVTNIVVMEDGWK